MRLHPAFVPKFPTMWQKFKGFLKEYGPMIVVGAVGVSLFVVFGAVISTEPERARKAALEAAQLRACFIQECAVTKPRFECKILWEDHRTTYICD